MLEPGAESPWLREGCGNEAATMEFRLEEIEPAALATRIADARLATVYAYWSARRPRAPGGRPLLPARSNIEPLELHQVWPQLLLADVLGAAQRVRYRLVGTEIVARWGSDDTGRYLDEMPASRSTDLSRKLYGIALSRRTALYSETNLRPDDGIGLSLLCRLILPLASDGTTVDMVLAGQVQTRKLPARSAEIASLVSETVAYIEVEAPGG
jgi:hypothetical protein